MTTDGLKEVVPGIFQKNANTFYIKCRIAGTLHYCCKDRLDNLVKKHGSLEKVGANYESRDAKRLVKASTPVKALQKMDPDEIKTQAQMVKEDRDKKREERKEKREIKERIRLAHKYCDVSAASRHVFETLNGNDNCLRPHLFKRNGGYCDGCGWVSICQYKDKMEKEFNDQPDRLDAFRDIKNNVDVYTQEESARRNPTVQQNPVAEVPEI